jgi:uncharacterized membrane protein YeaQ/YmgE (transglycosylase-associated protein family)
MNPLSLVLWIVMGAVAGWGASKVMGSGRSQGLLMDIVIGIVGAFVGGFLFNLIGFAGVTGFNIWSLFVAFIGAIVLLGIGRAISRSAA